MAETIDRAPLGSLEDERRRALSAVGMRPIHPSWQAFRRATEAEPNLVAERLAAVAFGE